jgi:hypothetical protein
MQFSRSEGRSGIMHQLGKVIQGLFLDRVARIALKTHYARLQSADESLELTKEQVREVKEELARIHDEIQPLKAPEGPFA